MARAQALAESPHPQYAERTAAALNAYLGWVYQQLSQHPLNRERQPRGSVPINFLLTKWAAVRPEVAPFQEQNGLRAASIENYPLYVGIARACGMTPVSTPWTADTTVDFRQKLRAADSLFAQGYEFVHVHSKAPDVAAHHKDPLGKMRAIEALDAALGPVVEQVKNQSDLLVVVTGDHATPSSGPLIHSGEAVPILIAGGPNVLSDPVTAFHERAVISWRARPYPWDGCHAAAAQFDGSHPLARGAASGRIPAVLAVAARTVSCEIDGKQERGIKMRRGREDPSHSDALHYLTVWRQKLTF